MMNLIYHLWNHKYQQNLLRGLAVVDKYEEELIISEYFRERKIQQTFFFCLFFFLVLLVPYAKVQVLPVTR